MDKKYKIFVTLAAFLAALFIGMKAEPCSGKIEEGKIEELTKKVFPSVVRVETINRIKRVATGVVIDKDGCIVTTALISPRQEKISIVTSEGKKIEAKFLGMDSETHLALIQAKDEGLVPITMGKSKDVFPGSWIGVVGISPENTPAVFQGIISSISKDLFRLNVWVVPGASGSPVVDSEGRMVGLIRGIFSDDKPVVFEFKEKEVVGTGLVLSKAEAPSSGLALAVPVDIVKEVTSEIKERGKVERGWLGVSIAENEDGEVEIVRVDKESPAELANLKRGDIILEIEGKKVTGNQMLGDEVRKRKPGETVSLKVDRDGKVSDVKVKLGELLEEEMKLEMERKFPSIFRAFPEPGVPPREFFGTGPMPFSIMQRKYIGIYLQDITRELSEYFGVEQGTGVLIVRITKGSSAEKAGMKVGDVIVEADGKRIENRSRFAALIQDKKKGDKVKVAFLRDKKKMNVEVEVEEEETGGLNYFYSDRDWQEAFDVLDRYKDTLTEEYEKSEQLAYGEYERMMERAKRQNEEATQNRLTARARAFPAKARKMMRI